MFSLSFIIGKGNVINNLVIKLIRINFMISPATQYILDNYNPVLEPKWLKTTNSYICHFISEISINYMAELINNELIIYKYEERTIIL